MHLAITTRIWNYVSQPEFLLCLLIGAELTYQMIHDRKEQILNERETRLRRAGELLSVWERQVGGGNNVLDAQSFEEEFSRHKGKTAYQIIEPASHLLWNMAESFDQLKHEYAKYIDFAAARQILKTNWSYLRVDRTAITESNYRTEFQRIATEIIMPVSRHFHLLKAELIRGGSEEPFKSDLEWVGRKSVLSKVWSRVRRKRR